MTEPSPAPAQPEPRPVPRIELEQAIAKLEADSLDAIVEVIGAPKLYNDGKSAMRNWFLVRLRRLAAPASEQGA